MADPDHLIPAIVLGHDQTGLGTLRSLHLAGIPTYVACPPGDLATRSRWYRPTPGPVAWNGEVGPQAYDILRAMPLEEAVLIPGADDAALWLADIPQSELHARFRVSTSSRDSLEILQNKARFGEFLARTGIPHPRTFSIDCSADIDAIPFDELDRVFIKPANSQQFSQVMGAKGIWARNRKEFDEIWLKLDAHGLKVMAQEYIPGSSSDHYFVDGFRDRNGNMTGLFARRRIRIYPPDFGNSSYCQSIPLTEVQGAMESVADLLSELNYRGIFSAEFKRDSRNGKFCILEVNTRAWWYVEFAARCGVNVCRMAFQDANGLPVTAAPRNYASGVGCVSLYGDIKSVLAQPPAARDPRRKILGQWARAHFHVFRFDDPGPGLSVAWNISGQLIRNNVRRALGRQ
ncbi:hypothetical protein [Dokdonella soli]|uniref:ATP-grasp domain-containing protein n=1 Tax=Dokdonella soli TaxID=529810 RepID=A0ABP3TXS7_9GAMM